MLVSLAPEISAWVQIALQLGMLIRAWQISHLFSGHAQWTTIWVAFGLGFLGMLASKIFGILLASGELHVWITSAHRSITPLWVIFFLFLGFELLYRMLARTPRHHTRAELPAPAGINTDEQSIVTAWDENATAMFGWSAADALGQCLTQLIIPERYHHAHLAAVARYLRNRAERPLSARYEVMARHQDRSEFDVVVRISIVPQSDGSVQFAGTINKLAE